MTNGLTDLTLIIFLAAILGIIARLLKQPTILAYLATGAVIGSYGMFHFINRESLAIFADLGIMFLLFLVGLEINYTSIKLVGRDAAIIGLGQIVFTFLLGFFLATLFHFSLIASLYIAIALTFSSTIIVVKLLSEKRDIASLYGKISIGILLIQDFVVILLLIILTGIEGGSGLLIGDIAFTVIKGVALFVFMLWLGRTIIPKLFDTIAGNVELLFLISLSWVFVVVTLVSKIGFSIEIGGFLAGIALANSAERWEISGRIKVLHDFFMLIFFVILGSSLIFSDLSGLGLPIILFSLFVLIGNPLIVLIIMWFMGYRKRTSFMTGITIAQISEFSLVLAALGLKLGHISENVVALITAVGVITITLSTYFILYGESLFHFMLPLLKLCERSSLREPLAFERKKNKPVVIIGSRRIGQSILAMLPKEDVLVIDYNPDIIEHLRQCGYEYLFDDMADPEMMEHINLKDTRLVISTAPGLAANQSLLSEIITLRNRGETNVKVIVRAEDEQEADILYNSGADYVLLPYLTSGHYLGRTIAHNKNLQFLNNLKLRDEKLMHKDQCWLLT